MKLRTPGAESVQTSIQPSQILPPFPGRREEEPLLPPDSVAASGRFEVGWGFIPGVVVYFGNLAFFFWVIARALWLVATR